MKPAYTIENRIPKEQIHYAILVYNWEFLNIVQNAPIIENSSMLLDKKEKYKVGLWKLKNKKI